MTLKEQAYAIIDGFTEKQLKGFVDLFSDPEIGDKRRETDRILTKLARIHLGNVPQNDLSKNVSHKNKRVGMIDSLKNCGLYSSSIFGNRYFSYSFSHQ